MYCPVSLMFRVEYYLYYFQLLFLLQLSPDFHDQQTLGIMLKHKNIYFTTFHLKSLIFI